jgi:CheY-like chemotaxis protein
MVKARLRFPPRGNRSLSAAHFRVPAASTMSASTSRPLVLLVEDSDDDAFFFRWSLETCGLECTLVHVSDGAAAIQQLEMARDGRSARPDLIFLDLKIPAFSGFEVLEWIRAHPMVPPLDVAVLSGSEHQADVDRAKALGASIYYVKPVSGARLRARFTAWRSKLDAEAPLRPLAAASPATQVTLT